MLINYLKVQVNFFKPVFTQNSYCIPYFFLPRKKNFNLFKISHLQNQIKYICTYLIKMLITLNNFKDW